MRLLTPDDKQLRRKWPDAYAFMIAAQLRAEMHDLLMRREYGPRPDIGERIRQRERLATLRQSPACREPWFVDALERDGLLDDEEGER